MKIAATRPLPGPAWDELEDVVLGERPDAEILVVMNEPVAFDAYPQLRLVANFSVGYDNIDVDECRRRGIAVSNTPGVLDAATADLAFGLILAARRRIAEGDRTIRDGGWRLDGQAREVSGATLAVIGMGRIGSAVARRAQGFDMRVLGVRSREGDLDAALREADVVSLHVPLSERTRGLISRERLALLRDGATLSRASGAPLMYQFDPLSATIIPYFFSARRITWLAGEKPEILNEAFRRTRIPIGGRLGLVLLLAKCRAG